MSNAPAGSRSSTRSLSPSTRRSSSSSSGAVGSRIRRTVDADTLEALVFLESAGRPYAQAGKLEGAAGLTQILAQTATSLLGMHVDLRKARKARSARALRRADDRFDPAKALAGTVRYLQL